LKITDAYGEFVSRMSWEPGRRLQSFVARRTIASLTRDLNINLSEMSMLEFGCGNGSVAKRTNELGVKSYTGVEPNQKLAAETRRRVAGVQILETPLPFIDKSLVAKFDVVFASMVLEHASSPEEALQWLTAMASCLNSEGILIVICPDIFNYGPYFWDIDWTHGFPTTQERLEQLAEGAGLSIIQSTKIRAGTSNLVVRGFCSTCSKLLPTKLVDSLSFRLLGRRIGRGLQSGLFWSSVRLSIAGSSRSSEADDDLVIPTIKC